MNLVELAENYNPVRGYEDLGAGAGHVLHPAPPTLTPALQKRWAAVNQAARRWHINPVILWGVYGVETSHGANVTTSSAGAKGSFQFIAPTARAYGYPYTNASDPATFAKQADAAAHYLHNLLPGGQGEVGLARGKPWNAAWEKALRSYSGGGYGLALVRQKSKAVGAVEAGKAHDEAIHQDAETVNPGGSGTGLIGELLSGLGGLLVTGVLLIAGMALVAFGIITALRPRGGS